MQLPIPEKAGELNYCEKVEMVVGSQVKWEGSVMFNLIPN